MEKIQVELNTVDHLDVEDAEPCESHGDIFFLLEFERVTETISYPIFTLLLEPLFIFYYYFEIYRKPETDYQLFLLTIFSFLINLL